MMLEIKNVHKTFDGKEILKGIDLNVEKGDVVAILGPSGSGKTTFLRCLNFLERADQGTINFDGEQVDLKTAKKRQIADIRQKTAFVFQNYNLFQNKTVLQNVTLGLTAARHMNKEEAKQKAIKALEKVGMADRLDSYPSQLSGGQQQRVAIARGLATDPEIIYFDEPTSALDPELIGEVLSVMRQLAEEGMTMLVVTHEMEFARNVSRKILFLEGGNAIETGPTKEFFQNPKTRPPGIRQPDSPQPGRIKKRPPRSRFPVRGLFALCGQEIILSGDVLRYDLQKLFDDGKKPQEEGHAKGNEENSQTYQEQHQIAA